MKMQDVDGPVLNSELRGEDANLHAIADYARSSDGVWALPPPRRPRPEPVKDYALDLRRIGWPLRGLAWLWDNLLQLIVILALILACISVLLVH